MLGCFCFTSAFLVLSSPVKHSDPQNVHHIHVRSPLCTFDSACTAQLESPIMGMELHCISPVCGLVRSAEHLCCISNNPPIPSLLSPLCLFIFSLNGSFVHFLSLHIHIYIYDYNSVSLSKKGKCARIFVRALSCLPSRARLKFRDRERFLLRPGVDS